MNVSKDMVLSGAENTKITSGFLVFILLISIHNFGDLVGLSSIYSWGVIVFQLMALMLAIVVTGSLYIPRGSSFYIALIAIFVLSYVFLSELVLVNIYYIYVIFLSPLVLYFLINASPRKDVLFIFDVLSPFLALMNFIPSLIFKEGLGYSGLLLTSSMFGMVSSVFAYIALVKLFYMKNIANLMFFLLWCFILFQSKHRAGMLALILASVTFIVLTSRKRVSVKLFYIFIGVLLTGVLITAVLKYSNLEIINKMFHDGNISFESINYSGRLLIWGSLLEGYFSNDWIQQLFGNGIGSSSNFILQNNSSSIDSIAVAHNEYIRLLFEYGALGLVLYFMLVYNIFNFHSSFVVGLPILAHLAVEMMFSNVFFSASFYLLLLIMAMRYSGEIKLRHRTVGYLTNSYV